VKKSFEDINSHMIETKSLNKISKHLTNNYTGSLHTVKRINFNSTCLKVTYKWN